MANQQVNIGSQPSDGSGDPIRVAYDKINQNFTEVYTVLGGLTGNSNVAVTSVTSVAGKTGNVTLTSADVVGSASKSYVDNQLQYQVNSAVGNLIGSAPTTVAILQNLVDIVANNPPQVTDFLTRLESNRLAIETAVTDLTALIALKESIINVNTKISANVTPILSNLTTLSSTVSSLVSAMVGKANSVDVYTKAEIDDILNISTDDGFIGEPDSEVDDLGGI